jgi:hypothetical protein
MRGKSADNNEAGDPDTQAHRDLASRLCALEYFACQLLTAAMPIDPKDAAGIDDVHRRVLHELNAKIAERISDMQADLAMSELQYGVRRLISLQREILGLPRRLPP